MSRTFSVVVLCPNARRETVKVSPNDSLLKVLEEACKKQKLNAEDYDIRHYNKTLDLSLPIRFCNLPNNAQLELRPAEKSRQDSVVTIGLQLESGERLMGDFPPSATVLEVLEKCLNSELTSAKESGEPVCIYMRQKITGDALKSTTLRSLGLIKGTAIIRLLYRNPEELENQAHVSTPLTSTSSKPLSAVEPRPPVSPIPEQMKKHPRLDLNSEQQDVQQMLEANDIKEEHVPMEVESNESIDVSVKKELDLKMENQEVDVKESIKEEFDPQPQMEYELEEDTFEGISDIKYIGERHAVIYSLDDITDIKRADLPDEFFDLTIKDAKYLMSDYRKQRDQFENQPLLTKEQRQNQVLQQFARYTQTVVRVYFPERLVLQAVFNVGETVQTVCDFLRKYLEDERMKFYLYITPPKEKLNPNNTLLESMLVPAAVVYFGCDSQRSNYLSGNLRSQLSDPRAAALAAFESRKGSNSNELSSPNLPSFNSNIVVQENTVAQNTTSDATSVQRPLTTPQENLPKWLKLSKK